jgi:radical SAM protein with 4Fe4S-binding SPASM domain
MDCPAIPLVEYSQFSEGIHNRLASMRIPLDCTLEVTYRCNLKCRHCYCTSDPSKRELSFKEASGIIDQLADAGCLWLLITGGEPLIRGDFIDLYIHAKRKGLVVTLFTNGTLLDAATADSLAGYRPFLIEITLYGATAATFDKVTGVDGSYERCMRGIRLLIDRRLPLKLKTCVTTGNVHELGRMKAFAKSLGIEFRFDAVLNSRYDGSKEPLGLRISPQDLLEIELSDPDRVKGWEEFRSKYWDLSFTGELFPCTAGTNMCHVDPYGKLHICMMARKYGYDILSGSFSDGWYNFMPAIKAMRYTREPKCRSCEANPVCDQCGGWALMERGDPEEEVEYLCELARLRARSFGPVESVK